MDRSGSSCSSYPADCTKARIIYTARGHHDPHSSPLISLERQRRVLGLGLLPAADRLAAAPTPQNSHKREWREESDLPSPVPNTVPRSQSTTTLCFTQSVPDFYAVAIRKDPRRTREKRARCFFDYDGRNTCSESYFPWGALGIVMTRRTFHTVSYLDCGARVNEGIKRPHVPLRILTDFTGSNR